MLNTDREGTMRKRQRVLTPKIVNTNGMNFPELEWERDGRNWCASLVNGFITISVWDGRQGSMFWPVFDGCYAVIHGENDIVLRMNGVDLEEAKRLATRHIMILIHQLGAELGFWEKVADVGPTGGNVLLRVEL